MPVALALPAFSQTLLYGICAVLAIIGSIFVGRFISKWGNELKDGQNEKIITDARSETEKAEQTAAQESDALKKVDER